MLLDLARTSGADVAIALDPDADRCAVGAEIDGAWRMLTGDETGALLADHLLSEAASDTDTAPLIATTIVSGSLVERVCEHHGARFARTLTGFKWLVRAGEGLVYAYEEAIGHCVDPDAVRDKETASPPPSRSSISSRPGRRRERLPAPRSRPPSTTSPICTVSTSRPRSRTARTISRPSPPRCPGCVPLPRPLCSACRRPSTTMPSATTHSAPTPWRSPRGTGINGHASSSDPPGRSRR